MTTTGQFSPTMTSKNRWVAQALILVGLVAVLYGSVFHRLALQWWRDPDISHGFLVPAFVVYVLWRERKRWCTTGLRPSNWGLLVMLFAIAVLMVGELGADQFTSRFSLLILVSGMVLFLAGRSTLRALAFPLGFLIFMIPLPKIIYNQITFPLQLVASSLAASALEILRLPVLREGNLLVLPNYTLEVVEACSGIRSLTSLLALAVAYGYWAENRRWVQVTLAIAMFPIAVASNSLRIVGAGITTYFIGPKTAEGFFHLFSGWVIFLAAVVLMLVLSAVLRRIGRRTGDTVYA